MSQMQIACRRCRSLVADADRLMSHVQYHISRARRALITPMFTLLSAKSALDQRSASGHCSRAPKCPRATVSALELALDR
ncbi:hypothetical protein P5V15_001421 [Pogonomyrmex californicus]